MASLNRVAKKPPVTTHEGGKAVRISSEQELRRTVLGCMLFESTAYESGSEIAARMAGLIDKVDPQFVADLAVEARHSFYLRHVPLFLVRELARKQENGVLVASTLPKVIARADEMGEYLSIYFSKNPDEPLSHGSRKGIGRAIVKFNEYQLAKYDRSSAKFKLRDILRLTRPRPVTVEQSALWKRVVSGELATPDTWEVQLSSGADKKATFERLIREKKLGNLALLRNLRLMEQSGVDRSIVRDAIEADPFKMVLPFRFLAAFRNAPHMRNSLEDAMYRSARELKRLSGSTIVLVDVSGSMDDQLSSKSDMTRIDAACALAMYVNEVCRDTRVFSFSNSLVEIENARGFKLIEDIHGSQPHGGTYLKETSTALLKFLGKTHDRFIVITDEQTHDGSACAIGERNYLINVAPYKNGVNYPSNGWVHIDGFSERVVDFIGEIERESD